MYLGSLGAVHTVDRNGRAATWSGISVEMDQAMHEAVSVSNSQGHVYRVTQFQGGWLLDNCPLNIVFGQGWLPGQQEALAAAGLVPSCPEVPSQPQRVYVPTTQAPSQPLYAPPITISQVPAPGWSKPNYTPSGTRILPTGVSTPTGPQTVFVPGYGPAVLEPEGAEQAPPEDMPMEINWTLVLVGAGLMLALARRK